jgi:hypothetical protein
MKEKEIADPYKITSRPIFNLILLLLKYSTFPIFANERDGDP